jgi:hypothetical protein
MWLTTRHFPTTRPLMKLDCKRTGPYTISMIINQNSYKLDLPKTMRNHNVFQVSQLDHYTPPVIGQPSSEPHPVIVDDLGEWAVQWILDTKLHYRRLHYLIQRAGYNNIRTSWELLEILENACESIDKFQRDHQNKTRRSRKSDLGSGGIDAMEICRLTSFGHFLVSISFVGTRSSTNGVGMGFMTSVILSIGAGVSLCTGWSPRTVLLSRGTDEIVQACMRLVSLFSTCTQ